MAAPCGRCTAWLCIAFTLTVITNFALRGLALPPPAWVTYAPLAALLLTGLCLFAQPYAGRWRQTLQAGVAGRTALGADSYR